MLDVRAAWSALAPARESAPAPAPVDAAPPAARAWLARALPAGEAPPRAVEFRMRGEIRLGRWRRFEAVERLAPSRGFVWRARVGRGPLAVRGHDAWFDGEAAMSWRVAGLVPVLRAHGPDVARSAAGRLAAEAVFAPGSSAVSYGPGRAGDDHFRLVLPAGDGVHEVDVRVDDRGDLAELRIDRWTDSGGEGWRSLPFLCVVEATRAFGGGVRVPSRVRAGWDPGGDFFRATIVDWRA